MSSILDYFLERNIEAGDHFALKFEQKCRNIARFPFLGRAYSELLPSIRGVPLDSYVIFYTVTVDCIEIVRVVSGYQDLRSLFSTQE